MAITSVGFALFAAAVLILYYTVPKGGQWMVLLAASGVFYLWAGPEYALFLLLAIVAAYISARRIAGNRAKLEGVEDPEERRYLTGLIREKNRQILLLYLAECVALLLLCKACLVQPLSAALRGTRLSFLTLGLPMGISFYLFQSMGYVMDVYRGKAEVEGNPFRLALFLSYFPQLIQGPISRYSALAPQLAAGHILDAKQVSFGFQRMLWGYFKKLVIADRVAPAVAVLRAAEGGGEFALLTVLYALQIYADFTGGIDITLGFSQSLGITLPENFVRPFFSKNIAEFWRRWHISLGEWMKEYVFYPVSVSGPCRRLSKAARRRWRSFGKRLPVYAATVVTWLVTGLWHGLTANFVLWGMLNCAVIILSQELTPVYQAFHRRFGWKEKPWYAGFEMLRTFLLMNVIRACDLFPDVTVYFRRVASLRSIFSFRTSLPMSRLDWGILLAGAGLMAAVSVFQERRGSVRQLLWERPGLRYGVLFALFLAVVLMGCYGVGYDAASFIYNQF